MNEFLVFLVGAFLLCLFGMLACIVASLIDEIKKKDKEGIILMSIALAIFFSPFVLIAVLEYLGL